MREGQEGISICTAAGSWGVWTYYYAAAGKNL